ncbi:hypothetical protein ASPZODRAFT_11995 [Penicilliopsis zonata CBS 506.65]|uniref:Uncharacterized protein n=1 Tax=Penicilliopsis zonata CBS 506.65 TaxID=1073090 RepID=A0A1L9SVS1_9EURO|nr:hypothetical protein ASPZODRAFT_11995 [Penicilliopsis zonata CBS 506.65]OJJ51153.1 hypothetical protein ASPZODRAFT_11995 [Penicilliopsis zonata CBS 506.65]
MSIQTSDLILFMNESPRETSSPPPATGPIVDPRDAAVDLLVHKYGLIEKASGTLQQILDHGDHHWALAMVVERYCGIVRARVQDWEAGQVSVYDKALYKLFYNEASSHATTIGAYELYLAEFLMATRAGEVLLPVDNVNSYTRLVNTLPVQVEAHHTTITTSTRTARRRRGRRHRIKAMKRAASTADTANSDRLATMLRVFTNARDEYREHERNGLITVQSARFLRDTAENAMIWLRDKGLLDHDMLPEIEYYFDLAKKKATQMAGGRERSFDPGARINRPRRCLDSYRP